MAIVCPLCPQDACCHFKPLSPDPYIKKDADQAVAKFGHLNHLVDIICCISDDVAALESGSVQSIEYCGAPLAEVAGVVTIPAIVTDDTLRGTGCAGNPLSINFILTETAILDFPDTLAQTSSELTIPVVGALVGKPVSVGTPAAPDANSAFTAYVSASGVVTVRFNNYSALAIDPASGLFTVKVFL